MNIKKFLILSLSFFIVFAGSFFISDKTLADTNRVEITYFYSPVCPVCVQAGKFLEELQRKYPQLEVKKYEFSKNVELVEKFYRDYNVSTREQGFVPIIFTETRYFFGFNEEIGKEIENYIKKYLAGEEEAPYLPQNQKVKIPILGEIDIERFSIPLLAIIFGFFDGFNVCSLGALILILGLVIVLKSRKKILILGGSFILVTAIVYWVLILLWHQLFVFIGPYIKSMELLIGLVALAGGIYFLREFFRSRKKGAICKFGGISEKLSQKIQKIFEKKSGILMMLAAVFLFAAAITIIEFPCTAILPVIFTGILAQAEIPFQSSLFYIGLYVFFYMLDELFIFLITVFTMKIWITSPKFIIWLNLIAALMLFFLGAFYLRGLLA